jgi:putative ABC transport system permease protein
MMSDLRHAWRAVLRARGLTAATVVLLGVGVGASTTIFSAINGVVRRPLPYFAPDRLVTLRESNPHQNMPRAGVSAPNFVDWKRLDRAFEGLAAYRPWGYVITGDGEPERVIGARVSASLFAILGVSAVHGRTFLPDEDRPGHDSGVVISEEFWQRRFGSDIGALGTSLRLDGKSYTVLGVVPAGFQLPAADLWVPLVFEPYAMAQRGSRALSVIARLKPGVDIATAREDIQALARALEQTHSDSNAGWSVIVTPLQQDIVGNARTPLLLLFASAGALLVIACANLATLMLARSAARRREIAVRAALGAGRLRIVRQLVTESLITAAAGGTAGLLIAFAGTRFLANLGPAYLPRSSEISVDLFVPGFALLSALLAGLAFAVIPALEVSRADLSGSLKAEAAAPLWRKTGIRLRDLLVAGQVALALFLLVGAGLLVRSILRLQAVELGFLPGNVATATVSLPGSKYPADTQRLAFFEDVVRRIGAVPGIRAAGLVSHLPLAGAGLSADVVIEGARPMSSGEVPAVELRNVDAGYFRAMGIRVLGGREFAGTDKAGGSPVVIVDATFARRFLPNREPVGTRVRLGTTIGADSGWREIVGVVSGVRSAGLETGPAPTVYVPYYQNPWPTMNLVVLTDSEPGALAGALRREVRALDRDLPLYNVRSLEQVLARVLAFRRFQTVLLSGFAAAAMFLAVIGVYAALAYAVSERTRELGIRIALGAQRRSILALIIRPALGLMGAGIIMGGIAAAVSSRFLSSVLFEIGAWDPATFAGSAVVLAGTGLLASYLPAHRAARVDPIRALRGE